MDNSNVEAKIRQEFMEQIKKLASYYEDFETTLIPQLQSFAMVCKKRSLAVKINNLLVSCKALYKELTEIYKTKSWIPLEELEDKVVGFDVYLDTIQKEFMILNRNNLTDLNKEL